MGITLGLLILFVLASIWQAFLPAQAFGMMGIHHSPVMGSGCSHIGTGFGRILANPAWLAHLDWAGQIFTNTLCVNSLQMPSPLPFDDGQDFCYASYK
jgi:hypothetical protein